MDDRERARQRYEQRTASSWYKLAEGDNSFRVLPTPKSATSYGNFLEYLLHREVGPRKTSVRCGKDVYGKGKCWICDTYMPALRKKGQEARAAALEPKPVFTVQVAKVGDDGKMTGPMIFQPSKTIADQILSMFFSKKKVYQDADKGYNLSLSRTGTGKNDTRYGMIEADEAPSKVPKAIIDRLKPFSELTEIPIYSEAKQKAAVAGKDLVQEDEEEEEEEQVLDEEEEEVAPVKKATKKSAAAKKAKPEPEPEEEEEEEVEPEEDEEEIDLDAEEEEEVEPVKPAKKTAAPAKKAAKPAPVEEEDEEEEIDLDDDDPEPPKKAAPAKKTAKAKPAPVEEEEEEIDLDDELEDEEEEPEPPKKAVKKAVKKK